VVDLDPLSKLIQQAKFTLMGKSRSYVHDARVFAQALLDVAEAYEQLRTDPLSAQLEVALSENRRLAAENERIVQEYAEAIVRAGGITVPDAGRS
jgi:hypothetical protein